MNKRGSNCLSSHRVDSISDSDVVLVSVSRPVFQRCQSRLRLETKRLGLEAQGLVYIPDFWFDVSHEERMQDLDTEQIWSDILRAASHVDMVTFEGMIRVG